MLCHKILKSPKHTHWKPMNTYHQGRTSGRETTGKVSVNPGRKTPSASSLPETATNSSSRLRNDWPHTGPGPSRNSAASWSTHTWSRGSWRRRLKVEVELEEVEAVETEATSTGRSYAGSSTSYSRSWRAWKLRFWITRRIFMSCKISTKKLKVKITREDSELMM